MKIAYNPKTAAALTSAPANNDITFDLSGLSIYVKGERFKGTDTTYSVFKKHGENGGGYDGLVPVPDYNNGLFNRFLREDGTWQYIAGSSDINVYQSEDDTSDFRPVILGLTHSANLTELVDPVTGLVYVTAKIYACPSTGILYATKLYSNGKEVLTEHQSLADYVTLNTPLTITGRKTFYSLVNITNGTTNDDGTLYTRPIIYMDSSLYMIYSDTKSHTIIRGSAIRILTSNGVDTINILPDTVKTIAKIVSDSTILGTLLISTIEDVAPLVVNSATLVAKLNSDLLDGYHVSGLFEKLENTGNNLSITIGGTKKELVVNYAAQSGKLGYSIKFKNVSYLDVIFDGSKDIDLTGGIYYSLNSDYAKLLKINSTSTSTIATGVGTWTPISGKEYVFRQKWTNSAAGGDTADLAIYLDGNLTANMCLDGYYYSLSGFKKSGSDDNYVLLGGGGHKALSDLLSEYDSRYVNVTGDTMIGDLHVYAHTYCGYGTGSSVIDYNVYAMYVGTNGTRGAVGSYIGGIAFTHLLKYLGKNEYCNSPQGWIGLRTVDYPGSERSSLVFATKPGTGTSNTGDDIPIERMCITPVGNVGIGTTSPSEKLEVSGNIRVLNHSDNQVIARFLNYSAAPYGLMIKSYTNGSLHLQSQRESNNSEVFPLLLNPNGGNVGIGTTSPLYKLHVAGDSYTTGWSRASSGFYVEGTGVHFTHKDSVGEIDMTSNNEFLWGSSTGDLFFNYRAVSRGITVTNYIWKAGSSTSYASHTLGALTSIGDLTLYGLTSTCNKGNSTSYMQSALQIREYNFGGAQSDTWAIAPRLSWHWSGRVLTQIGLASNNELYLSKDEFSHAYKLVYETGTWGINITGNAGSSTYPAGFTSRGTSDWSGVAGVLATDWSVNGADIMFKYDGSKLNVITDGRFYQGIDIYGSSKRVLDEYDINHTTWGNADTVDGYHIGDLDFRYARTGYSFISPSDYSMTGSTDLQDWITNMYNQGGYKGYSSITVGSWWWVRSLDFSSPVGTIRTSGAMIIYSGDGNSNKNYKHFLVLDAYADLYGITSNEESWKYYSRFLNNRNYTDFVYSKSTSDSRYLRKDTNDSTPYQYSFTKTDDHAIKVGTIRGTAVGSQTGEYIHLYERVAIGSPSGWGSRNAPTYGLATYGGAWLATDTGNVGIGTTNPSYKLDVRGTIRSTDRIYANEWIQFDNWSGLYSPNNGAHFYPNNTTSYGQWQLRGSRNGYSGIHFGDSTHYMTIMDNYSDKGVYQEDWDWLWYFNARNGKFSVRTSSDFGADINLNGSVRTNSTYYGYGLYHLSYGSSAYALTSDGGATHIGSMSVNYATSAGNADTVDGYHASAFAAVSHTHPYLPLSGAYITGTNIADMKVNIRNYFNGKPAGTNCYVGSPNIIYNFLNDSAACDANSVCGIMALNPGYDNYNHGHFLVSHYGNNRIGMIGLGYLTWYGPNWFAYTSDIPTVTDYYWANVKVSASPNSDTSPTFNTCYTSNWFRSTGNSGWYSQTYGGGWYMTDGSWIRSYGGHGVVAGGFYHSSYGSSEYFLTSDSGARYWPTLYDGRYLQYEGFWNGGSGQNVDESHGMNFTYTSHGAPHHWGTTVTFEASRNSGYRLQLHGTGDNYLYFRNRSSDYGGWHSSGWKQILTNQDTYVASDGTNRGIINGAEVQSARHLLINGVTWNSNWHWSGQSGQPTWLWGSNDGTNMYVWNPSNFSVYSAGVLRNEASIGAGDTHAQALQTYFNNNYSSIKRDTLNTYYSSAYWNGSFYMGYFLSGYNSNPYGGFFVAHYNTPYYVGISYGSFNEQQIITSSTIGSQSVNYANSAGSASSAGNADTVDGYHASSIVKFYLSPLDSGASASSAKSWFTNTMPSASGAIVYNVPGSEKTIIAGKSSGAYGHMLQLNYDDNYLRILRYQSGSWKTTDWEKISAGYADSAGSVAWANVTGKPTIPTVNSGTSGKLAYYSGSVAISEMTSTYGEYDNPIYISNGIPTAVSSIKLKLYGFMFGYLTLPLDSITLTEQQVRSNQLFIVGSGKTVTLPTPSDSLVGMVLFFKSATGSSYSVSCTSTNLVYHNDPMSTTCKTIPMSNNGSAIFVCMKYGTYRRWVLFWCG